MQQKTFESIVAKIEEKCDGFSEEQYGRLAGRLLVQGGVSRQALQGMLAVMEEDDLWEISEQIPGLINERMEEVDSDAEADDEDAERESEN